MSWLRDATFGPSARPAEPPGPPGQPVLGNLLDFLRRPAAFLLEAGRLGDLVHFRLGPHQAYLINSPDYLHEMFVKQADRIGRHLLGKKAARKFIGDSLALLDGEAHRRERRLIMQGFQPHRMTGYAAIMLDEAQRLIERWRTRSEVALVVEMQDYAASVACRTLLGSAVEGQVSRLGRAMADFQEVLSIEARNFIPLPDWLPLPHKVRMRRSIETLHQFMRELIAARRAQRQNRDDLLSILLAAVDEETGQGMTDEQVENEAIALFIVGHETTSALLAWVPYLLDRHPEVKAGVWRELDELLAGRPPAFAELPRLVYLEQVIKEALRLYPSAWIISRSALADLQLGPYRIRRGCSVFASPFVTQRDARYFPEPTQFRPARFASGAEKLLPRYTYFPFGGGAGACLGQQFAMMTAKTVLAAVLQRYQLTQVAADEVQPAGLITLRPEREIHMRVKERSL